MMGKCHLKYHIFQYVLCEDDSIVHSQLIKILHIYYCCLHGQLCDDQRQVYANPKFLKDFSNPMRIQVDP